MHAIFLCDLKQKKFTAFQVPTTQQVQQHHGSCEGTNLILYWGRRVLPPRRILQIQIRLPLPRGSCGYILKKIWRRCCGVFYRHAVPKDTGTHAPLYSAGGAMPSRPSRGAHGTRCANVLKGCRCSFFFGFDLYIQARGGVCYSPDLLSLSRWSSAVGSLEGEAMSLEFCTEHVS